MKNNKAHYIIATGADARASANWSHWNVTVAGRTSYQLDAQSEESAVRIVKGFEPNAPDSAFETRKMKWEHGKGYISEGNTDE